MGGIGQPSSWIIQLYDLGITLAGTFNGTDDGRFQGLGTLDAQIVGESPTRRPLCKDESGGNWLCTALLLPYLGNLGPLNTAPVPRRQVPKVPNDLNYRPLGDRSSTPTLIQMELNRCSIDRMSRWQSRSVALGAAYVPRYFSRYGWAMDGRTPRACTARFLTYIHCTNVHQYGFDRADHSSAHTYHLHRSTVIPRSIIISRLHAWWMMEAAPRNGCPERRV